VRHVSAGQGHLLRCERWPCAGRPANGAHPQPTLTRTARRIIGRDPTRLVGAHVSAHVTAELSRIGSRRRRCVLPHPVAPAPGVRPGGRSRRSAPGGERTLNGYGVPLLASDGVAAVVALGMDWLAVLSMNCRPGSRPTTNQLPRACP